MTRLIGQLADAAKRSFIKFMARPRKSRSTTKRRKQSSINAAALEAWQQRCYELTRENERLKHDAQDARAQLCQLRIDGGAYGKGIHKRIGYMVGTFIPEGVLEKLRLQPERIPEFKRIVVDAMVTSAVNALLHVRENGKQVAMVFVPHDQGDWRKRANLPVFETPQGFHIAMPEELKDEIDKMLLEQAEDERRKLLRY